MSAKRFGYHLDNLHFHLRNSSKMNYFWNKKYGYFSAPKTAQGQLAWKQIENHKKKKDYEKYLNPKGLKPTITSNFQKMGDQQDFVSHNIMLIRSFKPYDNPNIATFKCSPFLSKFEIKQYLMKIYGVNVVKVHTVNKQGRIMRNAMNNTRWRKQDWKKAIVEFDFRVGTQLQKHSI